MTGLPMGRISAMAMCNIEIYFMSTAALSVALQQVLNHAFDLYFIHNALI